MAYTLTQSVTQVRSLLDEATAQFWTDAELESWINQGCQDVARRAETLWQEVTINVTPLVQNYPFPIDFLNVHRAEFQLSNTDQTFNLEYRGINQMDEIWGILHSLPSAWPQYFTIRGNSVLGFYLMLYPSPGSQGSLTVYYYRQRSSSQRPRTSTFSLVGRISCSTMRSTRPSAKRKIPPGRKPSSSTTATWPR